MTLCHNAACAFRTVMFVLAWLAGAHRLAQE